MDRTLAPLFAAVALALGVAALPAACGGKVTVDGPSASTEGAGNAGNAGPGTGGAGATGPGSSSSAGGSGGGSVDSWCAAACTFGQQHNCMFGSTPDCTFDCVSAFNEAGECQELLGIYLQCVANSLPDISTCEELETVCGEEFLPYFECIDHGCPVIDCFFDPDGTCNCQGTCEGIHFLEECKPVAQGLECTCTMDGMPVATCLQEMSCDLEQGCCGPLLP